MVIYPNQKAANLASAESGVLNVTNYNLSAKVKPPVGSGLNKPSTIKLCAYQFFELSRRVIETAAS